LWLLVHDNRKLRPNQVSDGPLFRVGTKVAVAYLCWLFLGAEAKQVLDGLIARLAGSLEPDGWLQSLSTRHWMPRLSQPQIVFASLCALILVAHSYASRLKAQEEYSAQQIRRLRGLLYAVGLTASIGVLLTVHRFAPLLQRL